MEGLIASAAGKWQKALKAVNAKVNFPLNIADFGKCGNGLKTEAAIPKAGVILEVSDSISSTVMRHLDPMKEKLTNPILKFVDETELIGKADVSNRMRVAFQLSSILRDRVHPLNAYMDALPLENLTFPIYWRSPSATFSHHLRQEVLESVSTTRTIYDKIYNSERKVLSNVTFEEFIWTHYMACSRSLDADGHLHFVPLVDLLNHSFEANVEVVKKEEDWSVVATRDIAPQEQLLRNYGPFDSYQYLIRWGFFQPGNPHQVYYGQLDLLPDWDHVTKIAKLQDKTPIRDLTNLEGLTMMQMKKRMLNRYGLSLNIACLPLHPPASRLETMLRILFIQTSELLALGFTDVEAAINNADFSKPVGAENERRVCVGIIKFSSLYLKSFSDDWKPDLDMCIALEKEEKEILTRARDFYMSKQKVSVSARKD